MRGEYPQSVLKILLNQGSPPHAWRIPVVKNRPSGVLRITSTCVENTVMLYSSASLLRDHLHMRGEYQIPQTPEEQLKGSPPHAWRIHLLLLQKQSSMRITSTCVENTISVKHCLKNGKDHLHMRGEYFIIFVFFYQIRGSPPHAWRILTLVIAEATQMRITSTCVENTHLHDYCNVLNRDHLHMRGEYYNKSISDVLKKGSPPHAWRIHHVKRIFSFLSRITSTCVENTMLKSGLITKSKDHLHMRGEYCF